jgi:pimeloyl-ACP methyl ester carboxylesterase
LTAIRLGRCNAKELKMKLWVSALLVAILATSFSEPAIQFFDSDGVKLAYSVDGEGPPVILIHGFMLDANFNWRTRGTTEALARNFRVISLDVRGHGRSEKPHKRSAYGVQLAEDVVRLMDHLQIERAHVVGYSMGGEITVKLVTIHPDRLLSVVIGGAGWLRENSPSHAAYAAFADMLSALYPGDSIVEAMGGLPSLPDADREVIDANDSRALAVLSQTALGLEVSDGELRLNRVPALSVMGEHDEYREDIEALYQVMSNLSVEVVAGQNHIDTISDTFFVCTL